MLPSPYMPCAPHSEVWSCVWMGNWSESNFLYQWDLELWDSGDLSNFPPLYPINCQESCIFLFLLQSNHPLQLWEDCLKAHCNPYVHCSKQFHVGFLYTKKFALLVCTFLRLKNVTLFFSINEKSQFVDNVSICKLNVPHYNSRHTASEVNRIEKGGYKDFHLKTE